MNKSLFYQYLHYPELLDERSLLDMKKIIEEYPYFQSSYLLNVKNLSNQGNIDYDKELKKTAVWVSNRKRLFYLLDKKVLIPVSQMESEEIKKALVDSNVTINFDDLAEITSFDTEDKELKQLISGESIQISNYFDLTGEDDKINDFDIKDLSKKDHQLKLIDDFIINKPKITPSKEEVVETNIKNEEEEPLMITDTLAKIYIKQEKYDKAILAYEKLSLKYPKKSTYFVSQIKEIKQLINKK